MSEQEADEQEAENRLGTLSSFLLRSSISSMELFLSPATYFSYPTFFNLSTTHCLSSLTLDMADALLALPSSPHYFVLPSPTMSELGCLTEVRTIQTD